MKVASFGVGKHCPFGIRAVRVAQPKVAARDDFVLDMDGAE